MDRGFRRCNRPNLQTGAVAKKGVIGGIGRSRAPYAGGGSWRGVADRRTGRSGEWLGVACAVSPAIVAGGRSRRSGRKSERVTGPCGQMPRPRNGEAARQQPNRFGWMSDFRRRSLSLSRISAATAAGFLPAAVTAALAVIATVAGPGAAAAAIAGGATLRRRTCRAGRRGG